MKTTTIKIVLPDWARWIATDADGVVEVYGKKPSRAKAKYWYRECSADKNQIVGQSLPPKDFTKTLRRIRP